MRRFLAILLTLCLILALVPAALAEPAVAEPAPALPAVGDVVQGFEVVEIRDYALLDATVVRFVHQKTGGELFYIANDDTNRAFNLAFRTEAIDNTGLPHVFEHATVQGSAKYPGEQMYFNLAYQTYNTFLNAMTSQWHTTYPIASLSEAQLLKLAEFYTDACFYPVIMENEHIFRTEAWRYRLESPEDALTIEGTVYSEMLGATTLNEAASKNYIRAAFPGSMAGNDYGGDPGAIPDMTWEALKDYHDRYYHPSNSIAYLYGAFEDYTAFLALLDGYYSPFEKRAFAREDAGYTPIAAPVVETLPFPVEQGSSTEHASTIYYAFVCPGLRDDLSNEILLDTMTDLLSANASSLQQRLQEAIPYGSFVAHIDLGEPEDAIVFVAMNVDPGDAETFKAIVDESLADVVENGFPQDLVDGVAASLKISSRLVRESSDPVENVIIPMLDRYVATGNPWDLPDYQDGLFSIDDWNAQGLYARAAADWLAGSQTTALVTTYPEPGAKEENDAALAAKLADIKANMTDEEIAAIVEATNAEAPEDHSAEYVAQLKAVTVESLPEEWQTYEVTDETGEDGIRHIDAPAAVDGVSQANIFLDAAGLAQEDIHWAQLYTNLIGELDTTAHTKAELATLWDRYLYGGGIRLSLPKDGEGGYHPYLRLCWIALDDDLAAGYDLMRELVYETKVDDAAKLAEQVQSLKAGFKSSVTADPSTTLLRRAMARTGELYAYNSYFSGLEYYDFLGEVEALLEQEPEAVTAKLEGIKAAFNNRKNAVTMCAGSEASIALNRQLSGAFLDGLDEREIVPVEYDFPIPAQSEALVIDSGVQHNILAGDLAAAGLADYDGGLAAVSNLVTDTFLVPVLRDQYGVYTPYVQVGEDYIFIYAYRDPNIAETFDVLAGLSDMIAELELDQDTLDSYITNAYSDYAMPMGALTGPASAALDTLQGNDPTRQLDYMRQLKQVTPETVRADAEVFARLVENGAWMTAGAASAINANAELYDAVYNPFGAVDATQVAFSDVPEGSDHYDAVRFAFENGLMAPLAEDAFGVDEPATQGDLLAASFVLIGGELDAHEALAAFVEYGLAPADADLSAPVTSNDFCGMMAALTGDAVDSAVEPADPDAATRGELAEMLRAFMDTLQG